MDSIGKKTSKGILWSSFDKFGTMALQFGVNLILARLLLPEAFGLIGLLDIFLAVAQTIMEGGLASALIQKSDADEKDFSTVFFTNLTLSVIAYIILFFSAPLIASFYRLPQLVPIVRVLSLNIIANALGIVQLTIIRKNLIFSRLAKINIFSYIIAATAAVAIAFAGGNAWSIVTLMLGYNSLITIAAWTTSKWRPKFIFSADTLRKLFAFGGYFVGANILQEIARNLQGIIIGRRFSATYMGLYTQANKLDRISSYTIPNILVQVMYPVYSTIKDDDRRLADMLSMNTRLIAAIIFPIFAILIIIAPSLIPFLFGDKWEGVTPYYQILCSGGFFVSLQNIYFYAVAAKGKSRSLFIWSFYKWGFLIAAICTGMFFGMNGILWAMVISGFNIYLVNALLTARNTAYKFRMQIADLLPFIIIIASGLTAAETAKSLLEIPDLVAAVGFIIFYIATATLLKLSVIGEIKTLLRRFIKND